MKGAGFDSFNDKGFIIGSFRVVMPNDDANMKKIQQDFGSEKALIANLIKPTLYKVVTSCGPLMSSLESVSETRTDLIAYITDQLNNGVYKTVVVRDSVTNEITGEKELRAKAQIVADANSPSGYKHHRSVSTVLPVDWYLFWILNMMELLNLRLMPKSKLT